MFLTADEIITLTGKKRKPAQLRALRFMGIECKVRPDGALIVSRSHIENLLDGQPKATVKQNKNTEPNWGAIA